MRLVWNSLSTAPAVTPLQSAVEVGGEFGERGFERLEFGVALLARIGRVRRREVVGFHAHCGMPMLSAARSASRVAGTWYM